MRPRFNLSTRKIHNVKFNEEMMLTDYTLNRNDTKEKDKKSRPRATQIYEQQTSCQTDGSIKLFC